MEHRVEGIRCLNHLDYTWNRNFCMIAVEIATLTRENNKTKIEILKSDVVDKLIKKHEEEEAKAEAEKKKEKS